MQQPEPPGRLAYCLCAGAVAFAAGSAIAQEWKPARNVDIVVASAAAGSSDRTARVQADEWKKDAEKNAWAEELMTSAETRKHLDYENDVMSRLLVDLGVITK